MHQENLYLWQHGHTFGQDLPRPAEGRALAVASITGAMMAIEVVAGIAFGSMALLADGLHMASHAVALGVNAFAYVYARRHATDPAYSFGTGKVNALGGFSGAVLLAVFAFVMAWESLGRLVYPVAIVLDQAILVAVLGLVVNLVCLQILGAGGGDCSDEDRSHSKDVHHQEHRHDLNLKSAYLHVMADALTSVLAIVALLAAKYFGFVWMDSVAGIVGALLVARWSIGLLRSSSSVLLDRQGPETIRRQIQEGIEQDGDSKVADLHLWSVGPNVYAAIVSVVAHEAASPQAYKRRLPDNLGLAHVTVEVHQCPSSSEERRKGLPQVAA